MTGAVARLLPPALRVLSILFGAMWVTAALGKAAAPLEAWEFTMRAANTGDPRPTALWLPVAFGVVIAAEAALGVAMIVGAVRGFVGTILLLAVVTGTLLVVKGAVGGRVPCGCFSVFFSSSTEDALTRNFVMAGVAAMAGAIAFVVDRAAAGRVAAEGPNEVG